MITKRVLVSAILVIGLAFVAIAQATIQATGPATAQSYPSRLIKLILPYAAGSPPDLVARVVAQRLSSVLGQNVIIDNRPGGGTSLANKAVATAEPDGYTLLFAGSALVLAPALYRTLDYDPVKSFAPVALVANFPLAMVVSPEVPAKTVLELVRYAKANPGKLNYGAVNGITTHLTAELFKVVTGTNIVHVPYRSNAQAVTDAVGGRIQIVFDSTSAVLPFIADGRLRALAVTSEARNAELPNVPTMIESGLTDFRAGVWLGIFAPAGTPGEIVARLNAEINAGLKSAEMKSSLTRLGTEEKIGSPQEFAAFTAAEVRKWSAVVAAAGIKAE